MMSGKKTPRNLIQEYADNAETEKSTHTARRRRPLSRSPETGSISQPTVSSTTLEPSRSGTKKRSAVEEEFTPRHLIQGLLDTQDTAKPSTRKRKRAGELLPPSSSKVKKSRRRSSLGVPTLDKIVNQFTPRSVITGFLEQGVEETPEQVAAKGDKSSSRSSLGDLPNNEISFHPVEASFHGNKFAKEAKKGKGDRSRSAIHIVRRRSEKLARGAGEEIDFSDEEASDDTDDTDKQETEHGGDSDRSRRKSGYRSNHDIDDTSAKDTSSVDPSPRKSSQKRGTPSKKGSIASLKNASYLAPNKNLSVSRTSAGNPSPRESTPDRRKSKSKTARPRQATNESPDGPTPSKSRSKSAHARNASNADAVVAADDEDVDDYVSLDYPDESVKSPSVSKLKSRTGEVIDGSDLEPSPRNKSRSRGYDRTANKTGESSQVSSRNISSSRVEEQSAPPSPKSNVDMSSPDPISNTKSHMEVNEMSPARGLQSGSKNRSRLPDQTDDGDEMTADGVRESDDDGDEHSSLDVNPDEAVDEPRSGRSSPRHSTGLIENVYDFHDDSPSKRIIGKLAKTLQRSGSGDIINRESVDDKHYDNLSESEDDEDHYGEEPEESIIPSTDREIRTYYTPLRTPHLKEKTSSKPVAMVTSTPKPPTQVDKQQVAKPSGRQKTLGRKKDTGYMPASVVKGLFTHFCPSKVSKETIAEVERASAQFWEHAAKDLESYALHAHRKTIEESDVELLMKRQKFITPKESLPALVEKYLPLELRQEIIPICRSGNKLELK